ncbi:MAG: multidrug transporter [Candidatus Parcubacteria bacterium]|nr:multidrug transporter [Candidatus Parcubacteria bacterium]
MTTTYSLQDQKDTEPKGSALSAFRKMLPLLKKEKKGIIIAGIAILANSVFNLLGPLGIGYTIDHYVIPHDYPGVLMAAGVLLAIFAAAYVSNYVQMRVMGGVAQRVLWDLRNSLFVKLQELPLAFFNQNKAGDLISRINRDTERVNEFFSQGLMRFVGNIFLIIGAGIFILFINWKLGAAALAPGLILFLFARLVSGWIGRVNKKSLTASGLLSGEIQESIANFKIILAFNRRDYFKKRFGTANETNFKAAFRAGVANELFTPVFEWMGNVALVIVLSFGLYLIASGDFAIGLLVSFVIYVTRFYDPLREMARLWATLQTALAAWDRIGIILAFKSDLVLIPADSAETKRDGKGLIEFRDVSFSYPEGKEVLRSANFVFEKGKTYAFVGPTGGGKTTSASLLARLYDPTSGTVYLEGRDIRSYTHAERTKKIGFILQEPFLFSGTVKDNLFYGLDEYKGHSDADIAAVLEKFGFTSLVGRFERGMNTPITSSSTLSLGEKQIIAFMRAVLREPDLLILDEATANIDTVTEKVLEDIIQKLPKDTTRVIIAHRLNTIAAADDIFFVNNTEVKEAGSMEHAVEMLLHGKRQS